MSELDTTTPTNERESSDAEADERNVVLVVLDTVRQDVFAQYARRLSAASSSYSGRCYAASTWTVPSHASMFTGKLPNEHGVHAHSTDYSKIAGETFLDDLSSHRTFGVTTSETTRQMGGFAELFDEFETERYSREGVFAGGVSPGRIAGTHDGLEKYGAFLREGVSSGSLGATLINGLAAKFNDAVGRWPPVRRRADYGTRAALKRTLELATTDAEPFFGFVNLIEAHMPHRPVTAYDATLYDVPAGWSTDSFDNWTVNNSSDKTEYEYAFLYLRQLYRAAVDYLDRCGRAFVEKIRAATDRETVVVVTADHGEALGHGYENHRLGHGVTGLFESLVNVPFVVLGASARLPAGPFSQLSFRSMIPEFARGETPSIEPGNVPVERIGFPGQHLDIENKRLWDRMERGIVFGGNADATRKVVWDTEGNGEVRQRDVDRRTANEVVVQSSVSDPPSHPCFSTGIEAFKRQAMEEGAGLTADGTARGRLEDLGYI